MSLGAASVIFGFGLWLASPSMLLLALALLGLAHVIVVTYEEPVLARMFGQSYARYRATVRRWLPGKPV